MSLTTKTENIQFIQSMISVNIAECPLGAGNDDDAILLDCIECSLNSFKITTGNEACYECKEQDGFSCDGSSVITIDYNLLSECIVTIIRFN